MSIADHVGILLHSSLDKAVLNKANKNKEKYEFYANVALPPTAQNDLAAAMKEVAPDGRLQGLRLTVEPNGNKAKPHAGIPDDWLILRLSSGPDFPPDLFVESGAKIAALSINGSQIRTEFYSGQRVRVNGYPFAWNHTESGSRGISWNLSGVMAAGGGERRAVNSGEPSESAFAKYRDAAPSPTSERNAEAFAVGRVADDTAHAAKSENPFAAGGGRSANPFG